MRRIRLPLGRSLYFLCAFLVALAALLPLRLGVDWLGLDERGFSAREVEGTLWLGRVSEARLGSVEIGDLRARLRTLPLLLGRARLDLARGGEEERFKGALTVSRHGFGIDDVSGRLSLGAALGPLPVVSVNLADVSVRYADGLCRNAGGLVSASVGSDAGGTLPAGGFSGNARCDGPALLLPLVSRSGTESLRVRVFAGGRYRAELAVRTGDEATRQRLAAAGFTSGSGGYALRFAGEL
jgi:general secretion pathway protein N